MWHCVQFSDLTLDSVKSCENQREEIINKRHQSILFFNRICGKYFVIFYSRIAVCRVCGPFRSPNIHNWNFNVPFDFAPKMFPSQLVDSKMPNKFSLVSFINWLPIRFSNQWLNESMKKPNRVVSIYPLLKWISDSIVENIRRAFFRYREWNLNNVFEHYSPLHLMVYSKNSRDSTVNWVHPIFHIQHSWKISNCLFTVFSVVVHLNKLN